MLRVIRRLYEILLNDLKNLIVGLLNLHFHLDSFLTTN